MVKYLHFKIKRLGGYFDLDGDSILLPILSIIHKDDVGELFLTVLDLVLSPDIMNKHISFKTDNSILTSYHLCFVVVGNPLHFVQPSFLHS